MSASEELRVLRAIAEGDDYACLFTASVSEDAIRIEKVLRELLLKKPVDVCCEKCGEPIGNYVHRDGKVKLLIGAHAFTDAWANCEKCDTPWVWHSSDQALAHLLERVLERRKGIINP